MPKPGDALGLKGVEVHVGGCAGNFAIDVARLGLPVMLSARIGDDAHGKLVSDIFDQYRGRIDIGGLVRDKEEKTTFSAVCVNGSGERSILTYLGSTLKFCREDIPQEFLERCDIFFIGGALLLNSFEGVPEVELLKRLREQGKYTVMDTCYDTEEVWLPKIKDAIPYLDLFMPSYNEAVRLSGRTGPDDIVDFFLSLGAKNVILKMGEKGAYLCEQGKERTLMPSVFNENVVDTTGAGDSYCAGFVSGLALGFEFEDCARLGSAMGYCCVGSMGPQKGIRPLEEMMKLVEMQRQKRK